MTPGVGIAETSRSHSNQVREARRTSRWTVLLAVAAGALAGFVATDFLRRPAAALASPKYSAPATATEWMSVARHLSEPGSDQAAKGALAQALASDATLFRTIVEEYGRTEERPLRVTLGELILASARPDVLAAGMELTHGARGLQRGAGFELLARLRPTPERFAIAMQAVVKEIDPTALAGALMALRSPSLPSNAEAQQLLPRFVALAHDPDALVRAHAIQQLADWDKAGEQATPIVLDAMLDADRVVRQAAVGAVMIGGLRAEGLKHALMHTAANPDEDPMTRGAALHALARFALSDAEQAQYRENREALEKLERFVTANNELNHKQER